jgi:hypothetical protein
MAVIKKINLSSRGEVVAQLLERHKSGLVKDCKNLRLDRHPAGYAPKCAIDWASEEEDRKVDAKMPGAYSEGHQIKWPLCPQDCPHYKKADDFVKSVGRDQYDDDDEPPAAKPSMVPVPPLFAMSLPVPPTSAEKGTAHWLWSNLPLNVWFAFISALGAAVVVGIQATRLPIVRDIFGLRGGVEATVAPPEARQPSAASPQKPSQDLQPSPPATKASEPKTNQAPR